MNTNPCLESCLLTYQGCRPVRQIRLATRHCRIVAVYSQGSFRARNALPLTCYGNVDVIVQADRHHQGIEEVIAIGPPTDYTQIQVDFCWGEALYGPHTLALMTRVSMDCLAPMSIDEGVSEGARILCL